MQLPTGASGRDCIETCQIHILEGLGRRWIGSALIGDNLDRAGFEDRIALLRGEGDPLSDQRVVPGPAGDLEGRADIADDECGAGSVSASYREPAHRCMR